MLALRLFFLIVLLAQFDQPDRVRNPYPHGCYMSFSELQSKEPSLKCKLRVSERKIGLKVILAGNDFTLSPDEKCISRGRIENDMWAYSDMSGLYINCNQLKIEKQLGYSRAISYGRYLAFNKNGVRGIFNIPTANVPLPVELPPLVPAALGITGSEDQIKKYLFVIDMNTGKLFWVDSAYLSENLKDYPTLYASFQKERFIDKRPDLQLKYIQLMEGISLNVRSPSESPK
jgi:hypothetical protein